MRDQPVPVNVKLPKAESAQAEEMKWKHGIIKFAATGQTSKYILVPEKCDDPRAIWEAVARIWKLQPPRLWVTIDGMFDPLDEWFDWLQEKEPWLELGPDGIRRDTKYARDNFISRIKLLCQGVVSACEECDAWIWSFCEREGHCKSEVFAEARRYLGSKLLHWTTHEIEFFGLYGEEMLMECAVDEEMPVSQLVYYPDLTENYRSSKFQNNDEDLQR